MKREVSLQPLSSQHHDTLMACLMIEKGVRKNTDLKVLQDFTRQLWEKDVHKLMILEESHLVPYLRQKKFPEYIIQSLLRDHELLRILSARILNGGASYKGFLAFTSLLENHVKFEEKLVFEKAQELSSENELKMVSAYFPEPTAAISKSYPVKFWE